VLNFYVFYRVLKYGKKAPMEQDRFFPGRLGLEAEYTFYCHAQTRQSDNCEKFKTNFPWTNQTFDRLHKVNKILHILDKAFVRDSLCFPPNKKNA